MSVLRCDNITDIVALCGGGLTGVHYGAGILYAMHKSGKLMETDASGNTILKKSLLITASSGGSIPLLLLQCVINNRLHESREDWFEHYIIKTVNNMQSIDVVRIYATAFIKSVCIYNGSSVEIIRLCTDEINKMFINILPRKIIHGKSLHFTNTPCSQFKYNYVIDSTLNDSPEVSNDFTHLNGVNILTQISEIFTCCCVVVGSSHLINGITNDAALLVDNDILALDNYNNLKTIYYYTLIAYDAKTNNSYRETVFDPTGIIDRSTRIHNYRAINNLKTYCSGKCKCGHHINFKLITFPNKYNPAVKYNNKIYKDLVPNMFMQLDYPDPLRFLGTFNGDTRMRNLVFLIGAFETMSAHGVTPAIAGKITNKLPCVYKEVLGDPYNVYYKTDALSVLTRILLNV